MDEDIPIIDSHIHLFPYSEIKTLAWHKAGHPLDAQHSLEEYNAATELVQSQLKGFVFLETDRISHLQDESGWEHALDEVSWLDRVATGKPRAGEGHAADDAKLCLAIVPWAPIPSGPDVLRRYIDKAVERASPAVRGKITGFRYLVQEKPRGTMLTPGFVKSLLLLGELGYSFDLGVDQRSGGLWQLDEAIEMMQLVNEGVEEAKRPTIIINHLCKPDMLNVPHAPSTYAPFFPSFVTWRGRMSTLASFPNTYMKLSGGFSEIEPLPSAQDQQNLDPAQRSALLKSTTEHVRSWVSEALRLWGPGRCMFGSDWPVSNIGGGGNAVAWANWRVIIGAVIAPLAREDREMIWGGTAVRAYRIRPNTES